MAAPLAARPEMERTSSPPLGAILAGGASSRFGAPKAWAEVGGRAIVLRVHDALLQAAGRAVLVCNDPAAFAALGWGTRADRVPGAGPLAGIETALRAAKELSLGGALCVACDMPFVSAALLAEIAA